VQVPRKSYREYQADIYPDTAGPEAAMGPLDWIQGGQLAPPRISLNPAQRQSAGGSLAKHGPPLQEIPRQITGNASSAKPASVTAATSIPAVVSSNGCNQAGVTNGIGGHSPKLSTSKSNGTTNNTNENKENQLEVPTTLTESDGNCTAKEPRYW
jgi:coronin-7